MKGRSKSASKAAEVVTSNALTKKKACAPKRPKGQLAGNLAQAAPWEPSARDLEMYERHIRFVSYSEIGKEFGCSHVWALQVCKKVDQWKAQRAIDSIEAIRGQVMGTYSKIVAEALSAWEWMRENALKPEFVIDKETGATVEVRMPSGSPGDGYLKTALDGLKEIRKLWAADRIPDKKGGDENKRDDGFNGERVAGRSQTEMLEILVAKITKKIEVTT